MYFNKEVIDVEGIVNELFDFEKVGGLFLPRILLEEGRAQLEQGISENLHLLKPMQREEGPVIQEMDTLYLTPEEINELPPSLRDPLEGFLQEYSLVFKEIAALGNFSSDTFNSIGIHHYKPGSCGITPHQDYASQRDLIWSFVVKGGAPFGVNDNREYNEGREFRANAADSVVMRAARSDDSFEQSKRPFHYIKGPIEQDRYAIIVRTDAS